MGASNRGACAQIHVTAYMYSFHGHFATINEKGMREEITGSGHLGPNFVGVASVREGRGLLPRGMPQMVHLA